MALINIVLLLFTLVCSHTTVADGRVKIAIIDSGLSEEQSLQPYVCENNNLTDDNKPYDTQGHGTNIVSIISPSINPKTHCIVMYKVWHPSATDRQSISFVNKAFKEISKRNDIKYINMSMSGGGVNLQEFMFLKQALDNNVTVTVSAGNNGQNLDKQCDIYPACYAKFFKNKRFFVVGNQRERGVKHTSSNYGKVVNSWEIGYRIGTPTLTGTSQSSASLMAKILKNN